MAAGAIGIACRRGGGAVLGLNSRAAWAALSEPRPSLFRRSSSHAASSSAPLFFYSGVGACRHITQLARTNGQRAFPVDTLAMVRRLEGQGMPSNHAEVITSSLMEVLNDSIENMSQTYVAKTEMQTREMVQDANLSKFKSEIQSLQEHNFVLFQREHEKLRSDLEKMRNELRYEIDKVTAGQRLDLNLEKGRIRDELAKQNAETNDLTSKLDREIHGLTAQLAAAKYDVIKYCIGSAISIAAAGLALIRIMM